MALSDVYADAYSATYGETTDGVAAVSRASVGVGVAVSRATVGEDG